MHYHKGLGLRRAVAMIGVGLTLTACGYEDFASNSNAITGHVPAVVTVHDHPQFGKILTDSVGYTVYFAEQETDGTTRCTHACLKLWTPLAIPHDAPARAKIDGLGTVNRADNGQNQLTYQGKPLYTSMLDSGAGETKGLTASGEFDGTHFKWHVIVIDETPSGHGGFGL
jgi:predicted lipoprotein with Yx(FWY)xxD motif